MVKQFQVFSSKTDGELREELVSVQRALFGLRVGIANQAVENTAGIRKLRREIARIKTLQRQRQIGMADVTSATSATSAIAQEAHVGQTITTEATA